MKKCFWLWLLMLPLLPLQADDSSITNVVDLNDPDNSQITPEPYSYTANIHLVPIISRIQIKSIKIHSSGTSNAFPADAIGTVVGAALGTSTVTSFVESSAGVAAGGRTGLSSVVTAILFLLALFLTPLFLLIPSAATAPALIFVGYLMMKSVTGINFEDPVEGIPAFITILVMPFAYSIAEGIVWGVLAYVLLNVITGRIKKISVITWILFVIFILRFFLK